SRGLRGRDRSRAADDERGDRGVRLEQEAAVAGKRPRRRWGWVRRPRGRRRRSRCAIPSIGFAWPRLEGKRGGGPTPTGAPSASTLAVASGSRRLSEHASIVSVAFAYRAAVHGVQRVLEPHPAL